MVLSKANQYRMALNISQKATYLTINPHIVERHIGNISRDPLTNMPTNQTEIQSSINEFSNNVEAFLQYKTYITGDPMVSKIPVTISGKIIMKSIFNSNYAAARLYADMCRFMNQCSFDNKDDALLNTPKGVIKRAGENGRNKLEIFRQSDNRIVIRYKYEYEDSNGSTKEQWIRAILESYYGSGSSGQISKISNDLTSLQNKGTQVTYYPEY